MRVLVTGADGMLGMGLADSCPEGLELIATDVGELDITSEQSIDDALAARRPDAVINTAAYTDVDGCESHESTAFEVNATGAGRLARACAGSRIPLMHVSTDYVFDGRMPAPGQYAEEDLTGPLSAYGRTKLAGERAIRAAGGPHWIVRTQWLYGLGGKNFVETMLRLGRELDRLSVVDDQFGSPTCTDDLSPLLWRMIARGAPLGTYHAVNSGSCSWYDFSREIFRQADFTVDVKRSDSASLDRPAPRPARSVLSTAKLRAALNIDIPVWQDALRRYLLRRSKTEANVS